MITMKLIVLTSLSLSSGLVICHPSRPDTASASLISMADTDFAAEDSGAEQALVAVDTRGRSRSSKAAAGGGDMCFLCQDPIAPNSTVVYLEMKLHHNCSLACRAHWRLLTKDERPLDTEFRNRNPREWRPPVLDLVNDGPCKRDIKGHRDRLVHITGFREVSDNKEKILLTKRRFKSFQHMWENGGSETASESWDRRCDDSDSSHRNSDGEAQVRVRGNATITERIGRKTTKCSRPGGSSRRPSPREDDSNIHRGRHREGDTSRRGRSRSRRRREECGTPGRNRSVQSSSVAAPSQPSVRSSGRSAAKSKSQPQSALKHRVTSKTAPGGRKRGRGNARNRKEKSGAGEVDVLASIQEDDENKTMEYLEACKDYETKLVVIVKASQQKNRCAMRLQKEAGLLRPEHVTRLNKNGDYKIVVKTIGEKISSLQNMQKELEDLESHHVEAFKNHLKELMKELQADEARIEKLLESCSFLRHSYSEKNSPKTSPTATRNTNGHASSQQHHGVNSLQHRPPKSFWRRLAI